MDKKKIVAVVAFIFLGLFVFTFANPNEELEEVNTDNEVKEENKQENILEETENKEENQQEDALDNELIGNNQLNNHQPIINNEQNNELNNTQNNQLNNELNNQQNNGENNQLNKPNKLENEYNEALKALEKAKKTLLEDDYNNALDLINKLEDKKDLEKEINDLGNLLEIRKLLTELENKTNNAKTKLELDIAREFNTDKNITEKLNLLNNKELNDRYNKIQPILTDVNKPTVTGIEKEYNNEFLNLIIMDESKFQATLNGNNYVSNTEIKDGKYTLKATDAAFNETILNFIVDTKMPLFNIENKKHFSKEVDILISDDNFDYSLVTNFKTGKTDLMKLNNFKLEDEATYYIKAFDKSGNNNGIWLAIDNTNPLITDLEDKQLEDNLITNNLKLKVYDKFLTEVKVISDKEVIYTRKDFKALNGNEEFIKELEFNKDGKYTVIAKDKIGNITTFNFTIDTVKPILSAANISKYDESIEKKEFYAKVNDKIYFYITVKEELKDVPTFKLLNNDNVVLIDKNDIKTTKLSDNLYLYSTVYEIKESDNFKNGLITMHISDIKDKAGNVREDITKPTNYNVVHFDNTLPIPKYLFIYNLNNKENRKNIVDGEYLRIMVHFKEEVLLPKLIIKDETIDFKKCYLGTNNLYACSIDYKLDNSKLNLKPNEEIKFNVVVKDKALNEVTLNNDNITYNQTYGKLIYREPLTTSSVYVLKDGVKRPTLNQRLSASNFKELVEFRGLKLIDDEFNTLNKMILKSQEIKDYEVGMNIDNLLLKKYLTVDSKRKINLVDYNFYALKYNKLEKKWHLDSQKNK